MSAEQAFEWWFAISWFIGAPTAFLCFQYGLDLVMDAIVPMHPSYLEE